MFNKILTVVCVLTFIVASAWFTNIARAQQGVTSGLIAYWSFDEATIKGTTAEDVWGDSDGEIIGEPEVVKGQINEALRFDNVDDWVRVDSPSINIDYQQITLECWIFPEALTPRWNRIMSLDEGHGANEASLTTPAGDPTYGFFVKVGAKNANEALCLIPEILPTGQWLHMVGVYDGKEIKYYENGELKNDCSFPEGKIEGGKLKLGIASGTDPDKFDEHIGAIIDEVRLYNRALSEAEVKQNFAATQGLTAGPTAVDPSEKLAVTWGKMKLGER